MRKADVVLVVLGVLAATATLVGALSNDHWTDERTVRFATQELDLGMGSGDGMAGGRASIHWPVPANATSAAVTIDLTFQGQAVRGGNAVVTVRITTPDGRQQSPVTQAWEIPQGATSAQLRINASAEWHEVPGTLRDTTSAAHGVAWTQPLSVEVVVERPGGELPLANYQSSAEFTGRLTVYAAV